MRENEIERQARLEAQNAGWLVRKVMWVGHDGAPDRLFVKEGRVVFIELKRPGGKPRPRQVKEIKMLKAAGCEVHVADNVQVVREILGLPEPALS